MNFLHLYPLLIDDVWSWETDIIQSDSSFRLKKKCIFYNVLGNSNVLITNFS